ncbi:TPA: peptide pheromone SHP3 [Streptococcus pneumoniae]|jgi:hypothetical protein|uniref:Peptide pheromone SHP3 n=2 Tax=Streptococcus TaxID=1301 RepID=A0AA94RR70_9STRE|nr:MULTISPECIES: peptide pheromone SHP3 [Streptococcus]EDK82010.1 hypothetical protein CGSSp23BS72_03613 [Streptococcus pneumoniae SP23-BS72]MBF9605797.1 peptide pheromone SHP3 [Streptococcus pseudopneumoniae]MBF9618582.1 peptide pheromone SHP3 [Streptococcus pseudopneumoniae]MBF9635496.1 peptide pheromone SHP3 [Streptococcus pseudopneumoniae]MBF9638526.1 peptide pheromone SHP3 [Streptococcus pseudopneumoniae]
MKKISKFLPILVLVMDIIIIVGG